MIVTDRMLFLHLHKSGGTFVNMMLLNCVGAARQVGYHLPYRQAPVTTTKLPVVGTVRSPWAYYVSWFHFQRAQPNPNSLFLICSDDGALSFKQTVANLICLHGDRARLARLRDCVPHEFASHGLNLTKSCVDRLSHSGLGFYSFLYDRLYEGAHSAYIVKAEHLRQDIRSAFERVGQMPNPCIDRFLRDAPLINTSTHAPVATYFDEELAALVADKDRMVIDRHHYLF